MKKVVGLIMSLAVVAGIMSACSQVKVDIKKLDGKWEITEVNGTQIEQERMPYIEFNMAENKVHGNAGCNTFNTVIKPDSKNISSFTLAPAVATMMACPNMDVEGQIFKTFESVKGVKGDKDKLLLIDSAGKTLLVLEKK